MIYLSPAQLRILRLLAAGKTQQQVAKETGYSSARSFYNALLDIRKRMGAETTLQAAVMAAKAGLLDERLS